MSEFEATNDVAALTVQLLSAYLANNTVASEDLAGLIRSTKQALTSEPLASAETEPETFVPAVSVRKSLASPEHIISLIDGKPYKTLKRHLQSRGLTPDHYRSRYNLPASYPMVAPAYAVKRREVAQQLGLGRKKPESADSATADAAAEGIDGSAGPQPDASPLSETKQDRAPAEEKGRGRSATSASAKDLEPAAALSPVSTKNEAILGEAATSTSPEIMATDVPSSSGRQAKPVAKKPKSTSAPSGAAASRRGKSQPKSAGASQPTAEVSAVSQDSAADEELAQKPKRRAKLRVFKKTDDVRVGSPDAGSGAATARDPALVVAAVEVPTKRKSPKRMARSAEAKTD